MDNSVEAIQQRHSNMGNGDRIVAAYSNHQGHGNWVGHPPSSLHRLGERPAYLLLPRHAQYIQPKSYTGIVVVG